MKSKIKKGKGCLIGVVIFFMTMPIIMLIFIVLMMLLNTPDKNQLALKINVPLEVLLKAREHYGEDYPLYLVKLGIENQFDWDDLEESDFTDLKSIPPEALRRVYENNPSDDVDMIYKVYNQAYSSLKYFPIPLHEASEREVVGETIETTTSVKAYDYQLYDDFGASRNYKKETKHQGNDLVADAMTPLISITDGVIDRFGWNEYGGWRIGIKTKEGAYLYYAHMDQYASGLYKGKKIRAGDHIGYVGDTGYGPEGTEGKFINHLHFQIGVDLGDDYDKEYFWINTYDILKFVEYDKVIYYDDGVTSSSIENENE